MDQVRDNIETLSKENFQAVSPEEYVLLEEAALAFNHKDLIPCTACRYCMEDCPIPVDIPEVFLAYNDYVNLGDEKAFLASYENIKENNRAKDCIACENCKPYCPQSIDIPAKLESVARLVESFTK